MNKEIKTRIGKLEKLFSAQDIGMITVFYKDGTIRRVYGCEAVILSIFEGEKIERFEDGTEATGYALEGLAKALLIDAGK